MFDTVRTKRRRHGIEQRGVARYGDAAGGGKSRIRVGAGEGPHVNFSSPGLALIGLRRRVRRTPDAKKAIG